MWSWGLLARRLRRGFRATHPKHVPCWWVLPFLHPGLVHHFPPRMMLALTPLHLQVDNSRLQQYLQQKSPTFLQVSEGTLFLDAQIARLCHSCTVSTGKPNLAGMQLHVRENGKTWSQYPATSLSTDAATVPQLFMEYHAEGRHQEVVDFDDHLNDIRR